MAFTGTATVTQISDSICRITGLSLANAATGTIALNGASGTPGVRLPEAFQPKPYTYGGGNVALADQLVVDVFAAAASASYQVPAVIKSGTTEADFLITLNNAFASATPALEIYVKIHE